MKNLLSILVLLFAVQVSYGQISAIKTNQGTNTAEVEDIIIVFKMHFDIGYTDWSEGILQKYSGPMLRETLERIDSSYSLPKAEQFVWTVPSWPLKYMKENCPEDLKASLDKALRNGRITPHGLPITYQTEASDFETLVRGLHISDKLRKDASREYAEDAKLTDVPSHSNVLPTLLKNAGINFLHIGCNGGSASPSIPVLSFWEGVDGQKIMLMNWAEYYGSGILPPKNWPHKTWLAMIHTHENTGAPTLEEVEALLKEAKEKMPNARVRIGEMKDFYNCLMAENPNLPTLKGDMPDTWIHGFACNPRAMKLSREMHRTTYTAEALDNLLDVWGVKQNDHTKAFEKAIDNQILYDEHTFGIAMTHGNQQYWSFGDKFQVNKSLGEYDYCETSWREKQNRIDETERIVKPILRNSLRQIASNVAFDGKRVIVYNPSPWVRSDRVNMFMGVYQKNFTVYALKDLDNGKIIAAHNRDNLLSFDAANVPAMGYKTYQVVTDKKELASNVKLDTVKNIIENSYFKIIVDKQTGTLSSVFDKRANRELVDKKSNYKFGEFVHEIYGQQDLDRYTAQYVRKSALHWAEPEMGRPYATNQTKIEDKGRALKFMYEPMSNGARVSVLAQTPGTAFSYVINYTLYEDQPYVEITCGVNSKTPDARAEAAWLAFPMAIETPDYKVLRLGSVVDPRKDFVDGSNHYYYFTNGSMAMCDKQGRGIALDNPDAPAISIDSTGMFRYAKSFKPHTSLLFANLFSTQWGTNFTEWVEGSFHSTYRLRSFEKYDQAESLSVPAQESRSVLLSAYAEGKGGALPLNQTGISVDKKGVYVTAFTNDDSGSIIRLWDQTGTNGEVTVTLPSGGFTKAVLCNLRGVESDKTIAVKDNKIKVAISANQPLTIRLK